MNFGRKKLIHTLTTLSLLTFILLLGFGVIDFHLGSDKTGQTSPSTVLETASTDTSFDYQRSEISVAKKPTDSRGFSSDELENIEVYDRYNRAVVNITTEVVGYNWFLEAVPREGSSGSGSIIDNRGYILTNNHVVENAYKVNVTLADGKLYEGEVIGSDPENDLAVIKFNPEDQDLITIPFGSSADLQVGQKVLAIGNPFAFERTLTTGIISGLGRPLINDRGIVIRDLIQTDASINPGNSGGPLLNSFGELIGVNTMIYSPSGGSVGIGFAVPVDTAQRVVPDLIRHGFVQRGWIDIEPVQLFPSLVRYANLRVSEGILVSTVRKGGNAEKAGIKGGSPDSPVRSGNNVIYLGGDIIVGIDDEQISTLGDFYAALEQTRPGQQVTIRLVRGKKELAVNVALAARTGE